MSKLSVNSIINMKNKKYLFKKAIGADYYKHFKRNQNKAFLQYASIEFKILKIYFLKALF